VLAELRASGEPPARFAHRKGITRQRLNYWLTRLADPGSVAPPVFVEVAAVPVTPKPSPREVALGLSSPPTTAGEPIAISIGSAIIRVDASHDVEHVARLVSALASRLGAVPC
jgi:hypothetical protein